MADLSNKRIITVATTGAWPHKSDNPNLPTQPDDIVEDIYQAWLSGAAVAHIHVRDEEDNDSMNVETFKAVLDGLKTKHPECDIVTNMTSAGGVAQPKEARIAPFVALKPEMASFDAGSMNWQHREVFDNNPKFLTEMGKKMIELGVKPEIEVFDLGMIYDAKYYLKIGALQTPLHFQFCMGCPGGITATAENLIVMRNTLERELPGSTWSAFGVGQGAMEIMYTAIAAGGNIRVGMEDNVYYKRGVLAESNKQLIERARRVIEEYGCEAATPDEAREILGLRK